jgi:hypothetical protein
VTVSVGVRGIGDGLYDLITLDVAYLRCHYGIYL